MRYHLYGCLACGLRREVDESVEDWVWPLCCGDMMWRDPVCLAEEEEKGMSQKERKHEVKCPRCESASAVIVSRFKVSPPDDIDMQPVEMQDNLAVWGFWCPVCWSSWKVRADGRVVEHQPRKDADWAGARASDEAGRREARY